MATRLSFSKLSTFSGLCERRYAYDVLFPDDRADAGSDARDHGHQVHLALERWGRLRLGGQGPDEALATVEADPALAGLAHYVARALPYLRDLTPELVESRFGTVCGLTIAGRVDLVAQRGKDRIIVDYKTTRSLAYVPSEAETRRSLQLRIYSLALDIPRGAYLYLMPTGDAMWREARFSPDELGLTERWLTEQAKVIESRWKLGVEAFALADPGEALCSKRWCPHWSRCLGKVANVDDRRDDGPAPGMVQSG